MPGSLREEIDRPRRIVKLAASMAKNRPLKIWLTNDEYGTWDKTAKEMLAKVPALMAEKKLDLTEDQVDNEIAHMIYSTGLEAMHRDALKRQKR